MGYVAIKGGERAIAEASRLLEFLRARGAGARQVPAGTRTNRAPTALPPQRRDQRRGHLRSRVDFVRPSNRALAIPRKRRFTFARTAVPVCGWRRPRPWTGRCGLIRRISAAFKEVPGGQMLGPTPYFSQRLFNLDLIDESPQAFRKILRSLDRRDER